MSDGTQVAAEGAFVSDEQCLSCHGGTYEAVGALLADRGDWNPHDSIHGGYATCVNCHSADKVTDRNYCTYCHAYMPE
jgi:cytochrome c1